MKKSILNYIATAALALAGIEAMGLALSAPAVSLTMDGLSMIPLAVVFGAMFTVIPAAIYSCILPGITLACRNRPAFAYILSSALTILTLIFSFAVFGETPADPRNRTLVLIMSLSSLIAGCFGTWVALWFQKNTSARIAVPQ